MASGLLISGVLAIGLLSMLTACGPERATRQPITGVHVPAVVSPKASAGPGFGTNGQAELDRFANEVAADLMTGPATVALFPAFTLLSGAQVNAAGTSLMEETAARLAGRTSALVLSGLSLSADIASVANRAPAHICGEGDALELARRIGATHVVHGTVEQVGSPFDTISISVDWRCVRLTDGVLVSSLRSGPLVSGPWAVQLATDLARPGVWRICQADSPPPVEREFELLAVDALGSLLRSGAFSFPAEGGAVRLSVAATLLPGDAVARDERLAFASSFHRQLGHAEARHTGASDPTASAMTEPVTILGRRYGSFHEALDEHDARRRVHETSSAGRMAAALSVRLPSLVTAVSGLAVEAVPTANERERALDVIRGEALAYRLDGAIDPASIAFFRTRGAQVLVESSVDRGLGGWELQLRLTDLTNGRSATELQPFHPMFAAQLDALLAR